MEISKLLNKYGTGKKEPEKSVFDQVNANLITAASIKAPPGHYKLTGMFLKETDKAILMVVESINDAPLDEGPAEWTPLSQVKSKYYNKNSAEDKDVLIITEWIAKQKGFI